MELLNNAFRRVEQWKNDLGSALTTYAADQTDANWDAVVSAFVDGWASEYKLANE